MIESLQSDLRVSKVMFFISLKIASRFWLAGVIHSEIAAEDATRNSSRQCGAGVEQKRDHCPQA
jgi:hypothetical protein